MRNSRNGRLAPPLPHAMRLLPMVLAMLIAATTSALAGATTSAPAGNLDAYRWKARLLVVIAPDGASPALAEQRRLYRATTAGNADRDLVLIEGVGETPDAAALRNRFGVAREGFAATLVGKDGGAKLTSAEPISAERLFSEIDAMPMRRDEMDGTRR